MTLRRRRKLGQMQLRERNSRVGNERVTARHRQRRYASMTAIFQRLNRLQPRRIRILPKIQRIPRLFFDFDAFSLHYSQAVG